MTPEVQKSIRYYYVLRAIAAFGYGSVLATYVQFLTKNGLSLFQAHLMNFIFFAVLLVFEVPTGAFADRYGRKLSFVLSCFLMSLSKLIYAFSGSFWSFVVAEVISGIGVTFASGAIQAWLVDRLKLHLSEEECTKKILEVFTYENLLKNALLVISALIGSRLAEYNGSYPWMMTATCMFVAGVFSLIFLTGHEEHIESRVKESGRTFLAGSKNQKNRRATSLVSSLQSGFRGLASTILRSYQLARSNDVVVLVVMMGLAQHFAVQAPSMQWQPFLHQHLPRERELGVVFAGSMLMQLLGAWLAPRVLRYVRNEQKTLALTQVVFGVGIALTTLWSNLTLILLFFALYQLARGMYQPLKDAYLNHHIPSAERATLISFEALSHHIGGMAGLLVAGLLGQYVSMTCAWVIMGTMLIISGMKHFFRPTRT